MKLTAVGDILIQKRIAPDYKGFDQLKSFIEKGDVRFFNLETTLNEEKECFASQFSGGTYVRTSKNVLEDIKKFGFNVTSFNNNHSLDFSYDGLYKTVEAVNESGLVNAGVGYNLAEASAPRYLETKNGRAALISVNTTFNPSMIAGKQTNRVKGRPGINGLRIEEVLQVKEDEFEAIKKIAAETGINSDFELSVLSGYCLPLPENNALLGDMRFIKGDESKWIRKFNEKDILRVKKSIEAAKFQADEVIISIHTHELEGYEEENVPDFIEDFAHMCIDCGATAVIGHGPHLLRGIEVYKECPIFYSLGDFVLELYNVDVAPADFYDKYGVDSNESTYELLKKRSNNFTRGLMESAKMLETVIPYWETENGKLTYLELLPVRVSSDGNYSEKGLPFVAQDDSFMQRLAGLSKPFGTIIEKQNGKYVCKWENA